MAEQPKAAQFYETLVNPEKGDGVESPTPFSLADRLDQIADDLREHAKPSLRRPMSKAMLGKALLDLREFVDIEFDFAGFAASPGWDIMLDLFLADERGQNLSTSAVSIGARCPPTTALRWIALLDERELIKKTKDPLDQRRSWVSLTQEGRQKTAQALMRLQIEAVGAAN